MGATEKEPTTTTPTTIDAASASSSACVSPPQLQGYTYLTIGQDLFSITDYILVQYNATVHETTIIRGNNNNNYHHTPTSSSSPLLRSGGRARRESSSSSSSQSDFRHDNNNLYHHHRHDNNKVDLSSPSSQRDMAAAYMVYTDIQQLRGLDTPIDYGSGIEYANGVLSWTSAMATAAISLKTPASLSSRTSATTASSRAAPPPALQIGLWLNGTSGCQDILDGALHKQIHRLYTYLMEDCTATKVFLRLGYEFDNPSFGYTEHPELYRAAFRYLVHACQAQYSIHACKSKIAFVWHSWGASIVQNTITELELYYPGDDVVDWIGISLFSQFYTNTTASRTNRPQLGNYETVTTLLDFARSQHPTKPIMIAESSPFGGIDVLVDPWHDWFQPVLHLIDTYDIRMWSYIHCDWDQQPMWHHVGFGNSRLSINSTVLQLWRDHIVHNPRFLMQMVDDDDCSPTSVTTTTTTHTSSHDSRQPFHHHPMTTTASSYGMTMSIGLPHMDYHPTTTTTTTLFTPKIEHGIAILVILMAVLYLCMFRTALFWACCPRWRILQRATATTTDDTEERLLLPHNNINNDGMPSYSIATASQSDPSNQTHYGTIG